jgi:hypothetical protein
VPNFWGTPISAGSRIFGEKLYEIFLINFSFLLTCTQFSNGQLFLFLDKISPALGKFLPQSVQKNAIFVICWWILGPKIFSKNDPSMGNFMRGIDCARFRAHASLTLIQGKNQKIALSDFRFKTPIP